MHASYPHQFQSSLNDFVARFIFCFEGFCQNYDPFEPKKEGNLVSAFFVLDEASHKISEKVLLIKESNQSNGY